MSGIVPRFQHSGSPTYAVVEAVKGGQLVEGRTNGVGVAAAGSFKVLGVASRDAKVAGQYGMPQGSTSDNVDGFPVFDSSGIGGVVAVWKTGEFELKYAANANFGDKLIAAANGTVTPAGATPDARSIVGTCTEPGGVTVSTKATGLVRLGF